NRNKRTIALDLSKPEGREVLLKLLAEADVLIDNFKTGTMEKWGIGYADTLAKKFPRLVHARGSGFGEDGPLGGFPGYDAMVQARAGPGAARQDQRGPGGASPRARGRVARAAKRSRRRQLLDRADEGRRAVGRRSGSA